MISDQIENYKNELKGFIQKLTAVFGVDFVSFHFPAFEKFWPIPHLRMQSLQSKSLDEVFYVGDASGISFGALQCYVTANEALNEILM